MSSPAVPGTAVVEALGTGGPVHAGPQAGVRRQFRPARPPRPAAPADRDRRREHFSVPRSNSSASSEVPRRESRETPPRPAPGGAGPGADPRPRAGPVMAARSSSMTSPPTNPASGSAPRRSSPSGRRRRPLRQPRRRQGWRRRWMPSVVDPAGRVCLDVGRPPAVLPTSCSSGTPRHVYAVDVGKGLLTGGLRQGRRVTVMEETNARYLKPATCPSPSTSPVSTSPLSR